jgi:hypothetical protein
MRERFAWVLGRALPIGLWTVLASRWGCAAEAEVVSAQTPWRVCLVTADPIVREKPLSRPGQGAQCPGDCPAPIRPCRASGAQRVEPRGLRQQGPSPPRLLAAL